MCATIGVGLATPGPFVTCLLFLMASTKTNKNILFYKKWDEETAKAWLKKIFDHYDVNNDGFLERSEVNDWRKKTTHPKFFEPFEDDDGAPRNARPAS